MADRLQHRRDTAARWAEVNPVLLEGEIGYVLDNPNQYKIGDGEHAWNDLPLRGFTGTISQELGNDENAVVSQKVVTEAINNEAERAKDVEQSLSEEINNIKEAISNIGGEGGEGSKEVTRAEFELVEAQSKTTFEAFSKLGMTEKADADGYEIALTKSTNTAEKTKVKVPVFDAQNMAKNPVGLVDEIFVEDMASMMDDKIEDALNDFTPPEGGGSIEVVDSLDSTFTTAALSANQGKVLNNKIGNLDKEVKSNSDDTITNADNITTLARDLGVGDSPAWPIFNPKKEGGYKAGDIVRNSKSLLFKLAIDYDGDSSTIDEDTGVPVSAERWSVKAGLEDIENDIDTIDNRVSDIEIDAENTGQKADMLIDYSGFEQYSEFDGAETYAKGDIVRMLVSDGEGNSWERLVRLTADYNGSGTPQYEPWNLVLDTERAKTPDNIGYVILRKGISFAEQVTKENTIYEIRYDFDLGGETVTVPSDCVLKFSGGALKNGKIEGEGLGTSGVVKGEGLTFPKGVNLNTDSLWVKSSDIGMIPNNEGAAAVNDAILDEVMRKDKYLELTDTYYFKGSHDVLRTLKIKGGEIKCYTEGLLVPRLNSTIYFDDVTITGDYATSSEVRRVILHESLSYVVDSIIFENCTFNDVVGCRIIGVDQPYEDEPYGFKRVRIHGCKFYNLSNSGFILQDVVITDECLCSDNYVDSFTYTFLNFGKNNDYSNQKDNEEYGTDVVFKNNVIKGTVVRNKGYYTPLLLDCVKRAYFEGNTISNVIGVGNAADDGGHATYECYGTTAEYYCKDNVFINICQLPFDGILSATHSEIFKCKGDGGVKEAINNVWKIDYDECRELCKNEGYEFTDEQFKAIALITIFNITSLTERLNFSKNSIFIKGGVLEGNNSSVDVQNAILDGNIFDIASFTKNALFASWNSNLESLTISNNKITVRDGSQFTLCGMPVDSVYENDASVKIVGNVVNRPVLIPTGNKQVTIKDNIQEHTNGISKSVVITGTGEKSIIDSYLNLSQAISIYADGDIREFANIEYDYNVLGGSSTDKFIGVYIRKGVKANIIYDDGSMRAMFSISNMDGAASVTDEYGNILWSVEDNTVNSSYVTVLETSIIKLSIKNDSATGRGVFFYFLPKVTYASYKLNISSPDMNKIPVPKLNTYTKGVYKYDKTTNKPVWWNGSAWADATGVTV